MHLLSPCHLNYLTQSLFCFTLTVFVFDCVWIIAAVSLVMVCHTLITWGPMNLESVSAGRDWGVYSNAVHAGAFRWNVNNIFISVNVWIWPLPCSVFVCIHVYERLLMFTSKSVSYSTLNYLHTLWDCFVKEDTALCRCFRTTKRHNQH